MSVFPVLITIMVEPYFRLDNLIVYLIVFHKFGSALKRLACESKADPYSNLPTMLTLIPGPADLWH